MQHENGTAWLARYAQLDQENAGLVPPPPKLTVW
jgi:hypothetical protein